MTIASLLGQMMGLSYLRLCKPNVVRSTLDSGLAASKQGRIMGSLRSMENRGKVKIARLTLVDCCVKFSPG